MGFGSFRAEARGGGSGRGGVWGWGGQAHPSLGRSGWGFPGGSVAKNPPVSAGDRLDPWSGKIPHAVEQWSTRATATETVL